MLLLLLCLSWALLSCWPLTESLFVQQDVDKTLAREQKSAQFFNKFVCKCFFEICYFKYVKKKSRNVYVLLHLRFYNSTTYLKSKGKVKLQTRLTQNYNFVFTNFVKNKAQM